MSQPIYQQGEAQEALAQQRVTQQGLEGSMLAQSVSRQIGSDVRASIADQARNIAFQNEQTKAQERRALQQSLMQRGQTLRDLALRKEQLRRQTELQKSQLLPQYDSLRKLQESGAFAKAMDRLGVTGSKFADKMSEIVPDLNEKDVSGDN